MTGFGNPTWRDSHPAASATAPPVSALLAAGATVVGKTHLDELAYSLNGENAHYGTPVNVAAPGRIPGGSSSGSAVSQRGWLAAADGAPAKPGRQQSARTSRLSSQQRVHAPASPAAVPTCAMTLFGALLLCSALPLPDHVPARRQAAVAAGQADIGLGSDTGGSVRVPGVPPVSHPCKPHAWRRFGIPVSNNTT